MLKIGLFSKLSRVSIRMLRYYDEMGLLHPAYIDPESDYRYYREGSAAADQLDHGPAGHGLFPRRRVPA